MSASLLKRVDPGRYWRLLQLAVGANAPLALCDPSGNVVWSTDGCPRSGIGGVLEELGQSGVDLDPASHTVFEMEGGATLLRTPVVHADAGPIGSLAGLLTEGDRTNSQMDRERCGEALREVARCLASDATNASESDELADEIATRSEELNLVYAFGRHLHGGAADGIQKVLEDFTESSHLEMAALFTADGATIQHTALSEHVEGMDLVLTQLKSTLFRFIATRKRPVILNGDSDDAERRRYLFSQMPFRVLAYPLLEGSVVSGVLVLLRHPSHVPFSNSDRNLAGAVASQATILLRNQAMIDGMQRFGEQLAGALISAVEAKDPYTRGHSERVQSLAVHLGRGFELMQAEVEDLYWGALLHDIGKIGVPDTILSKPGRLTEDEYVFIKEHPEQSYEILRHIDYLSSNALEGARYHQEKFDGTGYPHGLAGKRIPFSARIIAVADTYDAITTSRSYRPAQVHEKALDIIRGCAGSQLDPEVVELFDRLCTEDVAWLERTSAIRDL